MVLQLGERRQFPQRQSIEEEEIAQMIALNDAKFVFPALDVRCDPAVQAVL